MPPYHPQFCRPLLISALSSRSLRHCVDGYPRIIIIIIIIISSGNGVVDRMKLKGGRINRTAQLHSGR